MKNRKKIKQVFFVCLLAIICCICVCSLDRVDVFAESVINTDGRYEVSYEFGGQSGIGGQMLKKYFDMSAEIEKIGTNYYLSITQLSNSMKNLTLNIADGMQVGYRITENDGNRTTYSYTLSEENISKELPFFVYVSTRDETFYFTVKLNLDSVKFLGDADKTTERPAQFVPILSTTAGTTYEAKKGQTFVIPALEANLGDESVEIFISAYYLRNGEKIEVAIEDNKITLDNVGEYHVVYRAESEKYLTLLGNPTYAEKGIVIMSQANGGESVKVSDINGILPNNVYAVASQIANDSTIYHSAEEKMSSIAERFQVFGLELITSDGNTVVPSDEITVSIKADFTYNRNDIAVYHLDKDGMLTKLFSENGGSYVNVTTDKVGTFIVCVPGVTFVMPIWSYVLIVFCVVILVAAAVSIIIVRTKRKQKAII